MILRQIEVQDFRNLAHANVTLSPRTTLFVGPNGHGKTNLVEAIFFLMTLKPLRASRLSELVRWGSTRAKAQAIVEVRNVAREIAVDVEEGVRRAYLDGKPTRALEEYFGGLAVVAFTPDDLGAVKGGPEGRRKLLDRATFNRFPAYLQETRDYQRALRSRNRLLRQGASPGELDAFAEPLARLGARLYVRRLSVAAEIGPRVASAFRSIAGVEAAAEMTYRPAHLDVEALSEVELQQALRLEISRRTAHDVERGFTSVGPHVDDVVLSLRDRSARAFASQGQQRALVIAMKIAEIENLRATLDLAPLLMLDDVSSELDPERNHQLMAYLAASGTQAVLTTTDARVVAEAIGPEAKSFRVRNGVIEEGE